MPKIKCHSIRLRISCTAAYYWQTYLIRIESIVSAVRKDNQARLFRAERA